MNYIGIWRFHSVGVINESGNLTYLNADEYLNSPMPYIDETDEEAIMSEMRERLYWLERRYEEIVNGVYGALNLDEIPEEVLEELSEISSEIYEIYDKHDIY